MFMTFNSKIIIMPIPDNSSLTNVNMAQDTCRSVVSIVLLYSLTSVGLIPELTELDKIL